MAGREGDRRPSEQEPEFRREDEKERKVWWSKTSADDTPIGLRTGEAASNKKREEVIASEEKGRNFGSGRN